MGRTNSPLTLNFKGGGATEGDISLGEKGVFGRPVMEDRVQPQTRPFLKLVAGIKRKVQKTVQGKEGGGGLQKCGGVTPLTGFVMGKTSEKDGGRKDRALGKILDEKARKGNYSREDDARGGVRQEIRNEMSLEKSGAHLS